MIAKAVRPFLPPNNQTEAIIAEARPVNSVVLLRDPQVTQVSLTRLSQNHIHCMLFIESDIRGLAEYFTVGNNVNRSVFPHLL